MERDARYVTLAALRARLRGGGRSRSSGGTRVVATSAITRRTRFTSRAPSAASPRAARCATSAWTSVASRRSASTSSTPAACKSSQTSIRRRRSPAPRWPSSACSASRACSTSTCRKTPTCPPSRPLQQGVTHPVIPARKGTHRSFRRTAARNPRPGHAVLARIERVLSDENLRSLSQTMANIEQASGDLPGHHDRGARAGRRTAQHFRFDAGADQLAQPDAVAGAARPSRRRSPSARVASDKLAKTADGPRSRR